MLSPKEDQFEVELGNIYIYILETKVWQHQRQENSQKLMASYLVRYIQLRTM